MNQKQTNLITTRSACGSRGPLSLSGGVLLALVTALLAAPGAAKATLLTNFGTAVLDAGNGSVLVKGNGVTTGCIDWFNVTAPSSCQPDGTTASLSVQGGSTAPFVSGQTGLIADLNFNTVFPVIDFITVGPGGSIAHFDLKDLRVNTGPDIGSCTQATGDLNSGVTCMASGSAFQITNGVKNPVTGVVDTVTIMFNVDAYGYVGSSGTNYNQANPYIGIFATHAALTGFNIDTILAQIQAGSATAASWSATLSPSAIPEPATCGFFGMALVAFAFSRKRLQ
jgi:hypothetical protein